MNSSESAANGDELILKTEEYDIEPTPSAFVKSVISTPASSTGHLVNVNFNNNSLTVNCGKRGANQSNSVSPKLETYCPGSPSDRMPIPAAAEMQSTAIAATTPGQHSMSPSLPPQQQQQQQQQASAILNGSGSSAGDQMINTRRMTSLLGGYGLVPPGILGPLDHYRLQLYSYAMNVERLRGCGAPQQYPGPLYSSGYPGAASGSVGSGPYAPTRFALSMGLFPNRMFQPEEPKPQHSYIGLIAMAILSSPESKLVLSDIYQYILDNYPYFRTRGPGWRNSIRHNLSLNDCFIKAGRSANGKGHYWAIHPANMDDFRKGDFRRRKAQRKVRKHMGLAVDDEGTDSPSPPPLSVTPPPMAPPPHPGVLLVGSPYANAHHPSHTHFPNSLQSVIIGGASNETSSSATAAGVIANLYSQSRKRQFDVASLLAPDETTDHQQQHHHHHQHQHHHHHNHQQSPHKGHLPLLSKQRITLAEDEDIDVVASDVDEEQEQVLRVDEEEPFHKQSSNRHHHHHHHQQQQQQDNHNSHASFTPPSGDSNHQQHYQTSSPVCHHDSPSDLPPPLQQTTTNPSLNPGPTNWQGLMHHWPNEFGTAAAAAAAAGMDPRIFGRYYSQYMAAAAARRVAGVFPAAAAAAAAAAVIGQQQSTKHQQASLQQQQQQQPHHQQHSTLQQKQQSYEC